MADTITDGATAPLRNARTVVFISHSSKDGGAGERLAALIKNAFDLEDDQILYSSALRHSLPLAADVSDTIRDAIGTCKAFIGLVSPNTYESSWEMLEIGAGWLHNRKFILLTMRESYLNRLKSPLSEIRGVGLDQSLAIHQIVDKVAEYTGMPAANPKVWAPDQDGLVRFVRENYPAEWPDDDVPVTSTPPPEPPRSRIRRSWISWALAAMVFLLGAGHIWKGAYVSAQIMKDEVGVEDASVLVAGQTYFGNPNGYVRFPMGLPGRPLVISARKKEKTGDWLPTTVNGTKNFEYHQPLWAYLFEPVLKLTIDGSPPKPPSEAVRRSWLRALIDVAWASERAAPSPPAAVAAGNEEFGMFVDSIQLKTAPWSLFRSARGYFRVSAGGNVLNDHYSLVTAPATLQGSLSAFPVRGIRQSWILLYGAKTTQYGRLFARLPLATLISLRDDTASTSAIRFELMSDTDAVLATFNLPQATTLGKPTTVQDAKSGNSIVIRSSMVPGMNIEWQPNRASIAPKGQLQVMARLKDPAPCDLDLALTNESTPPTALVNPPARIFFKKGQTSATIPIQAGPQGTIKLAWNRPKALGGSGDDIEIVIAKPTPAGRRR